MASLATVRPTRVIGADSIQTRQVGPFAQPPTHKKAVEVIQVATSPWSEDLGECTRVQFVNHLAIAGDNSVERVRFEVRVVLKLGEPQTPAPLADYIHVMVECLYLDSVGIVNGRGQCEY